MSMFAGFLAIVSGKESQNMGAYAYIPIVNDTYEVVIGEIIRFNTTGDQIRGKYPESITGMLYGTTSNLSDYITLDHMSNEGLYGITNTTTGADLKLSVVYPKLGFFIKDETGTEKISTLTKNGKFTIDITGNLPPNDVIDLVIIGPKGYQRSADATGKVLVNQAISTIEGHVIDTSGWSTGTYDISVVTVPKMARGLDIYADVEHLTTGKPGIKIRADDIDFEIVNVYKEISTKDNIRIEGTTAGDPDGVVLVLCGEDVAAYLEVNVTDNVFEGDIGAGEWNWYTKTGAVSDVSDYTGGTYKIYAVHQMGDGTTLIASYGQPAYPAFEHGMEYIAKRGCYGFESLYQSEISDDVSAVSEVTITNPYLILDPLDTVVISGEDLNISGTTNMANGTLFEIKVSGHGVKEQRNSTVVNGTILAIFDTTKWPEGIDYLVTLRDESKTVLQEGRFNLECMEELTVTLEPINNETLTVNITEEATPTAPAEKEPGFEITFAVTGLLLVAYLVIRGPKNKIK